MIKDGFRVLVTGADHHYGLSLTHALARGGVHVIAGSASHERAGFESPDDVNTLRYPSPAKDRAGFLTALLEAIERTQPDLVMPADDATFAAILPARIHIEKRVPLAAAPPSAMSRFCDVRSALQHAQGLRVPVPYWTFAPTAFALLDTARAIRPPFVVKPRGHGGASDLPARLDFRIRRAAGFDELARIIEPVAAYAPRLVVMAQWCGITRVVAGVWRHGRAVARIAFERERELPGGEGSSVVRRTIPLDTSLDVFSSRIMADAEWNGAGLVEFNYDRRTGGYTFLGVRSRLHDAAALCMPAGVNLPLLAAAVHLDADIPEPGPYREGIVQRWLGGDVHTLLTAFASHARRADAQVVSRRRALWRFVRDFGRASRYDEFRVGDWLPSFAGAPPALQRGTREMTPLSLSARH